MNRVGDSLFCTGSNEEIVVAFSEAAVEFIVVGGLAVAWYCNHRQADDMDLLVNPSSENSVRVCQALIRLGLIGFTDTSFSKLGLQVSLKQRHYADLLTPREGAPTFSTVAGDAVSGRLFKIPVLIASINSLIQMKALAAVSEEEVKQKHLNDIDSLRFARIGPTSLA